MDQYSQTQSLPSHKWLVLMAVLTLSAIACFSSTQLADAANPKVIGIQAQADYKGKSIPSNNAASKGLACIQKADGKLVCFDSVDEAASSEVALSEATKANGSAVPAPTGATAARKRNKAKISVDCNNPANAMVITQHADFNWNLNGWDIIGYARSNWYNMTGGYANSATSLSGGDHSGYLADLVGGGYPRANIAVGDCRMNLSVLNFNDKAQSRYRN